MSRRVPEKDIPIRLEIDSFFSFVRHNYAIKDVWDSKEIGFTYARKQEVNRLIEEWHSESCSYFENDVVKKNYPKIIKIFSSQDAISHASYEEILDALCVLHSFYDRLRFFAGGLESLKETVIKLNDIKKVRETLTYLLHGNDDIINRMGNCIFDSNYKLNQFGKSNIQELIGWVNKERLPVVNSRTTKVLRYFGFNVRQVGKQTMMDV